MSLTTIEAAEVLGCSDRHVRRLAALGALNPLPGLRGRLPAGRPPQQFDLLAVAEVEYRQRPESERDRLERLASRWLGA